MKTILIFAALTLMGLVAFSQNGQFSYVITQTDTVYSSDVKTGYCNARVKLSDGKTIKIDNHEITKVYAQGKLSEKMPVYINNRPTGETALMKLVDFQNGVKIYKYEHFNGTCDCMDAIFSFYSKGQFLISKTNPSLDEIVSFVAGYNQPAGDKTITKQLVIK